MFLEGAPAGQADCFLALLTAQHSALAMCLGTALLCARGPGWGMGSQDQSLATGVPFLSSEMFSSSCGRVHIMGPRAIVGPEVSRKNDG